jgi:hypothetical protein
MSLLAQYLVPSELVHFKCLQETWGNWC